jgi:uncharacterized protein (DUF934 family)
MPTLIKHRGGRMVLANDSYTHVDDEQETPPGDVIISLARFQTEGEQLLSEGRSVGVRLKSDEEAEALAYDLPRISLVALSFPKFLDGRHYSNARLLRERYGFKGELRAVGDVLREQAHFMLRAGFDAYEPADGSTPEQWEAVTRRFRHVYQRGADDRVPAFLERQGQ